MTKPVGVSKFEDNYPKFQFNKGHRFLFITELFYKIVPGLWRALKSFGSVTVSEDVKKKIENPPKEDSILPAAYKQLQQKSTLGISTVIKYTEYLHHQHSDRCLFFTDFLFPKDTVPALPERGEKDLVFIPVVLHKWPREHIVAVVYDAKKNRVEFYDPKGLTSEDHSEYLSRGKNLRLSDFLKMVAQRYGNKETTLWENTEKHQKDYHNCGVYILDYFERRLQAQTPEHIAANGRSFSEVNNGLRAEMLRKLAS